MKLMCQCCGIEAEFADGEAAFQAGWDAPPHFTGYVACNLCPAVCLMLPDCTHRKAHSHWAEHGRPTEFGPLCLPDNQWGKTEEQFQEMLESGKKTIEKLIEKINGATGSS